SRNGKWNHGTRLDVERLVNERDKNGESGLMERRFEITIHTLVFSANPDLDDLDAQLQVDYLPDTREVVVTRAFPDPFEVGELSLHIENVELRLSEEAVRQ